MFTLWIIVIATSLSHPAQYQAVRVGLAYETQYVCEKAQERVDADVIKTWATKALRTEARRITIRELVLDCRKHNPNI